MSYHQALAFTTVAIAVSITGVLPSFGQVPKNPVVIYVNPNGGSDLKGNGSIQAPLQTITKAIARLANRPGMIQLTAGTYGNGEIFPLRLPQGVILRGDETSKGAATIIQGGGNHSSEYLPKLHVAVLASDRAELRGVTITNPEGYGIWAENQSPLIINSRLINNGQEAITILGNSQAVVRTSYILNNRHAGIAIAGNAQPTLEGNIIQGSNVGIDVRQRAKPKIQQNQIQQNQAGIFAQASSRPWLRQNQISQNRQQGLLVLGDALPDLGVSGQNILINNLGIDIQVLGAQSLQLQGNQFGRAKVQGQLITAAKNTQAPSPLPSETEIPSPPTISPPRLQAQAPSSPPASSPRFQAQAPSPDPIPRSPLVRIAPEYPAQPPTPSAQIDYSLPPVALTPPPGAMVNRPIVLAPPARPITASGIPPRYRVVVPGELQIEQIRQRFPQAFTSRHGNRVVIQVGAFGDRRLANSLVQDLSQAGFSALIEAVQ
ncbi:MAG: DUF1565 domain-containing protein [Pseudanabaenaceae cyanobacterium bins.68]|nr:DUF1565 domain-containing protein [Pseudanabaenaceae cyanobacterium bins.68]